MREITAQERAQWQAACEAATPEADWDAQIADIGMMAPEWAACGPLHAGGNRAAYDQALADVAFLAIVRDALPRLLAENAALRAANDAACGAAPIRPVVTQPPLLAPDAVQLGLGGLGSYASDLGGKP